MAHPGPNNGNCGVVAALQGLNELFPNTFQYEKGNEDDERRVRKAMCEKAKTMVGMDERFQRFVLDGLADAKRANEGALACTFVRTRTRVQTSAHMQLHTNARTDIEIDPDKLDLGDLPGLWRYIAQNTKWVNHTFLFAICRAYGCQAVFWELNRQTNRPEMCGAYQQFCYEWPLLSVRHARSHARAQLHARSYTHACEQAFGAAPHIHLLNCPAACKWTAHDVTWDSNRVVVIECELQS